MKFNAKSTKHSIFGKSFIAENQNDKGDVKEEYIYI